VSERERERVRVRESVRERVREIYIDRERVRERFVFTLSSDITQQTPVTLLASEPSSNIKSHTHVDVFSRFRMIEIDHLGIISTLATQKLTKCIGREIILVSGC